MIVPNIDLVATIADVSTYNHLYRLKQAEESIGLSSGERHHEGYASPISTGISNACVPRSTFARGRASPRGYLAALEGCDAGF